MNPTLIAALGRRAALKRAAEEENDPVARGMKNMNQGVHQLGVGAAGAATGGMAGAGLGLGLGGLQRMARRGLLADHLQGGPQFARTLARSVGGGRGSRAGLMKLLAVLGAAGGGAAGLLSSRESPPPAPVTPK